MTKRPKAEETPSWIGRAELALGLALVVLLLLLHVVVLRNAGALWRDEANSATFALMPSISDSFQALRYDSLPLGGTVALRTWSVFTATDQGFRAFGLVAGLGILAALLWSSRLLGVQVPLLSLSLFAMSPVVLRYGDSIRPYGLGALLVVTTAGLVGKLVRDDARWVKIAAPVSAILAVQCLYQNAFLVFGLCAGGIATAVRRKDRTKALLVLGTGALAALSLLPYLGRIRAAGEWSAVVKQPTSVGALGKVVLDALGSAGRPLAWVWLVLLAAALVALVLELAGSRSSRSAPDRDVLFYSGVALGVAATTFLGFIVVLELNTQPWYFLPLMALAALLLDAMHGAGTRTAAARQLRVALALIVALAALPATWSASRVRFTNVDTVASKLEAVAKEGDVIVVSPWYFGVSFHRAYRGGLSWTTLPPMRDLTIHRYDLLKEAMATRDPLRPMSDAVENALRSGNRVYVVGGLTLPAEGESPRSLPPATSRELELQSGEYIEAWLLDLGFLLRSHALDGRVVQVEERGPVSPLETLPIFVFEGYRP